MTRRPPIRHAPAELWFREQVQKESHGALLLGHSGGIPVAKGNVILRLAAVLSTSGCVRDRGLQARGVGTQQLPGCGRDSIILHQLQFLYQVTLQWLGNLFLECSQLSGPLQRCPSISPLNKQQGTLRSAAKNTGQFPASVLSVR